MFVCSACDCPDVCYDAWVSVNTNEVWAAFDEMFCPECEGPTSLKEIK